MFLFLERMGCGSGTFNLLRVLVSGLIQHFCEGFEAGQDFFCSVRSFLKPDGDGF